MTPISCSLVAYPPLWLLPMLVMAARPMYDPYIACYGEVPPQDAPWPADRTPNDYNSVLGLCSLSWGMIYNLGCFCESDQGSPDCDGTGADPVLYAAQMDYTVMTYDSFLEFCQGHCVCVDYTLADDFRDMNQSAIVEINPATIIGANNTQTNTTASAGGGQDLGGGTISGGVTVNATASQQVCGTSCTTKQDCLGTSYETSCKCMIQSSEYVYSTSETLYTFACMVTTAGGGKRHETEPCACNTTYVSHGCCDSEDGRVWEAPEAKLGELRV